VHVPLKLIAEESTGTPVHVGAAGTLAQTTPCATPDEFWNATDPGEGSSTWEGDQQFG
jgi:hypothetical protein